MAPLDEAAHLDAQAWAGARDRCTVRRFWANEDDRHGLLRHKAGGAHGATWIIDYDPDSSDDDEPGYRLESHVFAPGEYVTIKDQQGAHTFRIASVSAVPSPQPSSAAVSGIAGPRP